MSYRKTKITLLLWAICTSSLALIEPGYADVGLTKSKNIPDMITITNTATLPDIAYQYDLGFQELLNANPGTDPWNLRPGTVLILPNIHLLPDTPRDGISINVASKRLFYFGNTALEKSSSILSFPVSIGRIDWPTPAVTAHIIRKEINPNWYPPESIRREHALEGEVLPSIIKSGPQNPLGEFALYLEQPGYLIHGTNKKFGIGMEVTHGCIRLYPDDIRQLFDLVPVGTKVYIVNQPYLVGWKDNQIYIEVHTPYNAGTPDDLGQTVLNKLIISQFPSHPTMKVDWDKVDRIYKAASGMPEPIGIIPAN